MKNIKNIVLILILLLSKSFGFNLSEYLSPSNLVSDREGKLLYIVGSTANKITVFDLNKNEIAEEIKLPDNPSGIVLLEEENLMFVTAGSTNGNVYSIDLNTKKIINTIKVGHTPNSPLISNDRKSLYINNRFNNNIFIIDIRSSKVIAKIPVIREPVASILTPDGNYLFVANLIPYGPADQNDIASVISVIDLSSNKKIKDIRLPNGSNAINGINISHDGKYVYAVHILARYQMPTTQLEKGWINTNALSIVRVDDLSLYNTVLLDDIDLGAANPWDVACTDDDKYLCVSHTGSHELSIIDREKLHAKLVDAEDGIIIAEKVKGPEWVKNDLAFIADIRRRVPLEGLGPRGITIKGNMVYIAEYFTGTLGIVDITDYYNRNVASISLGSKKIFSAKRRGELLFHDASRCFQKWQSCLSCHPGGGRSDALNWDLLNDGLGNPKNSKNLLLSHKTPPVMSTGIRDRAETAVRAGIKYIEFAVFPEQDAIAIDEYLKSLKPVVSPYLIEGELSESAKLGENIFKSAKCVYCHSGPLYTDLQKYVVGTGKGKEKNIEFDTPTIIENWRSAPYLHDGRAADIKEVLTKYNKEDKHGITSNLSDDEINDLVEFILSQ